jgi:hypothetical protein
MRKTFVLLALISLPLISFSQFNSESDTTVARIKKDVCGDIYFVSVQLAAIFNNGESAFEDSLTSYLKRENLSIKNGEARFKMIVTKSGQVLDIQKTNGTISKETEIMKAILTIPNLWIPAKQNSHSVCSFVSIDINISNKKLSVTLLDPMMN